ncbi:fimbrial protein [Pseudomonas psychrophila]|uniref:fimbrial protein n=1 Tax=Pseudomonas psychrophila TaxID=122355 RepID=UPI0003045B6B|nr:fimbrial protein [Pseudomonas psychrophila]
MNVVMKSALASMALLAGSASVAHAAGAGEGTVTFKGAIIEAACSIDPDSVDQTVGLGQVAKSQLAAGGNGRPEEFYIKLTGCDPSSLTDKTVTTTFTGAGSVYVPGALGIVGDAKGAGIMMVDGAGALVVLGTATTPQALADGNTTLSFGAYLKGQATGDITPGEFTAVTNFSLAYQ